MRKVSSAIKSSMPVPAPGTARGIASATPKTVAKRKIAKTTSVKAKVTAVKAKVTPTAKSRKLSPEKILTRNEKIQSLYSTGKYSIRALAAKVGMSKSRVGEIV